MSDYVDGLRRSIDVAATQIQALGELLAATTLVENTYLRARHQDAHKELDKLASLVTTQATDDALRNAVSVAVARLRAALGEGG